MPDYTKAIEEHCQHLFEQARDRNYRPDDLVGLKAFLLCAEHMDPVTGATWQVRSVDDDPKCVPNAPVTEDFWVNGRPAVRWRYKPRSNRRHWSGVLIDTRTVATFHDGLTHEDRELVRSLIRRKALGRLPFNTTPDAVAAFLNENAATHTEND